MDVLMITCPNTGRAVPPGIETDALSFASLPDVPTQTNALFAEACMCTIRGRPWSMSTTWWI